MINIKSQREIELMRQAGKIAGGALKAAGAFAAAGVSTEELDRIIYEYIVKNHAEPTFLHYNGFPKNACISVNNQVIHGIPGKYKLKGGDIVKIDVGATYRGYIGDCADTFLVGEVDDGARRLADVTRQSFYEGIKNARAGNRVSDISFAIENYVVSNGFSAVRKFVGHGVGQQLHEDPEVPNFGAAGRGPRLYAGMTLAIEPMINYGGPDVTVSDDGWTVMTADGKLSAHFEHTVLITDGAPEILTELEQDDEF